jgi:hypothetical protein
MSRHRDHGSLWLVVAARWLLLQSRDWAGYSMAVLQLQPRFSTSTRLG